MSTTDAQRAQYAELARAAYAASGFAPSADMVAAAASVLARLAGADDETPLPKAGITHAEALRRCADA